MTVRTQDTRETANAEQPDRHTNVLRTPLSRRDWVRFASGGSAILAGLAALGVAGCKDAQAQTVHVTLYATEECGCCHQWAERMTTAGFDLQKHLMRDVTPKKDALMVPLDLRSCHTAEAGGYVFEGHVPPELIKRFLAERPADHGLAVPGMPGGSPGMEDSPKQAYQVLAFQKNGSTRVYADA